MQDIEMVGTGGGGGASRIFSSGIDRRLRTQNGINQQQQALKCPRCDSLNTKFCYYNNYNLSQPRHFCKGCRRYWTKGGVLRKVPVGGGCRKAKRAAKPKRLTSPSVVVTATDPDADRKDKENSSSESSSLTAATTLTGGEAASGNTSFVSAPPMFSFAPECDYFGSFIDQASEGAGSMFPEVGGLMASSDDVMTSSMEVGFATGEISAFVNDKDDEERMRSDQDYLDQTAQIDSGIFDLTGTVDQTYWTQSQWPDHADHSAFHYLP